MENNHYSAKSWKILDQSAKELNEDFNHPFQDSVSSFTTR